MYEPCLKFPFQFIKIKITAGALLNFCSTTICCDWQFCEPYLRFPVQFFFYLLQSVAIDKFTNLTYGSSFSLEALPDLFFICCNLMRLANLRTLLTVPSYSLQMHYNFSFTTIWCDWRSYEPYLRFLLQLEMLHIFCLLQSDAIDEVTNLTCGSLFTVLLTLPVFYFICCNLMRLANLRTLLMVPSTV